MIKVTQIVAINQVGPGAQRAYFSPSLPTWKEGESMPELASLPIVALALVEQRSDSDVRPLVLKPDGTVVFIEELPGFLAVLAVEMQHQAQISLLDKINEKQAVTKKV